MVTALGRAVKEEGHQVEVILPRWAGLHLHQAVRGVSVRIIYNLTH